MTTKTCVTIFEKISLICKTSIIRAKAPTSHDIPDTTRQAKKYDFF